ncbi:deoxyhypusine synthase, putative [Trypanosoma brucei gambiense DAL972]|uniref:Deoxyhypusine synthase, putative n=1 Tax=Trypanosoma brucei gambiense (strain MHOM/CI/86/DAL972) TaxID=679716 RepID=C9ZHW4_TRYB9|nr:deoxyhypusine synthase, putative [Trypanosoma brucei gambiense DAL972]CBH08835.1 deoxyhypusine synthase, putative [Trypanosoma brucei gambiense DAL972]|eukprot:XP_011771276.1 deoxyhypusine synthase, putative [Trypanosoma brucei gambiense DAL972]
MSGVPFPSRVIGDLDYSNLLNIGQEEAIRCVLNAYPNIGLEATNLGRARRIVQRALNDNGMDGNKVMLAYTSNLISSGLRDTFACLARENRIGAVVTTAGGVEEDVIKCLGDTLVGDFALNDHALRNNGLNRVGNLLVPNDNYRNFEDFFVPLLRRLHEQQRDSRWTTKTTPSQIIAEIGAALESARPNDCGSSLIYWCYRNDIPVFSPAFTDGSMGDMIYFYNYSRKGLVVDPVPDVRRLRQLGCKSTNVGRITCIVLGAGLPKHHLLRNVQADAVVYVTTGSDADGCESSCNVMADRANGLLSPNCDVVRVHGDATIISPLLLLRSSDGKEKVGVREDGN